MYPKHLAIFQNTTCTLSATCVNLLRCCSRRRHQLTALFDCYNYNATLQTLIDAHAPLHLGDLAVPVTRTGQSDTVLAALLWQDRPRGTRYQLVYRYAAATFHPRSVVI